jgi:hypothetical protein
MVAKLAFLACFQCFFSAFLSAQTDLLQTQLVYQIDKKTNTFAVDKLGFLYTSFGGTVQKYDAQGKLIYTFNENNLGKIAHLDAYNPLGILAFYPDYWKGVVLDRTLSELSRFDLSAQAEGGILQAVALSSDNNIWVYNPNHFAIQKINAAGKVVLESPNLGILLEADYLEPIYLTEQNNKLYLQDAEKGVWVFDAFANFIQKIPVVSPNPIQIQHNQLFYSAEKSYFLYDMLRMEFFKLQFSEQVDIQNVQQFWIQSPYVWLKYSDKILCYQLLKE